MNIDNLLDIKASITAYTSGGDKVSGRITDVAGDDVFVFQPQQLLDTEAGRLLKISDGNDAILAKVIENGSAGLKMAIECYATPGKERREDVRINDKIYYNMKYIGPGAKRDEILDAALQTIRADKLIIDSFLKGRYGSSGGDDMPYTREAPFNQTLWEINRKLDLLIHMYISDDFKDLMGSTPQAVNISASGLRFICDDELNEGDLLDVGFILPMVPLLFMRVVAEVIRVKPVTSYGSDRYAIATRFVDLDNDAKDDIVRYLFRRQREILRRRQDLE